VIRPRGGGTKEKKPGGKPGQVDQNNCHGERKQLPTTRGGEITGETGLESSLVGPLSDVGVKKGRKKKEMASGGEGEKGHIKVLQPSWKGDFQKKKKR